MTEDLFHRFISKGQRPESATGRSYKQAHPRFSIDFSAFLIFVILLNLGISVTQDPGGGVSFGYSKPFRAGTDNKRLCYDVRNIVGLKHFRIFRSSLSSKYGRREAIDIEQNTAKILPATTWDLPHLQQYQIFGTDPQHTQSLRTTWRKPG